MHNAIYQKGYLQTSYARETAFPLSLYSCAVREGHPLHPHYHDNFEIIYVKEGKVNIRIGNDTYYSEGENIFFVNMFQVHYVESADGHVGKFYAIVFDKKMLDSINMNDYYITYIQPFLAGEKRLLSRVPSNSQLFHKLAESLDLIMYEYSTKGKAYEVYIKTEIERIFATMVRYSDHFDSEEKHTFSSVNKKMMDDMWSYIQNNYQHDISLDDMAQALNMNKHYFCRVIKKLTGKPFTQLLNIHRVYQAERLLTETDIPVSHISDMSGFSNQSYFNRMYLKYTGNTPSVTRKSVKNMDETPIKNPK